MKRCRILIIEMYKKELNEYFRIENILFEIKNLFDVFKNRLRLEEYGI